MNFDRALRFLKYQKIAISLPCGGWRLIPGGHDTAVLGKDPESGKILMHHLIGQLQKLVMLDFGLL